MFWLSFLSDVVTPAFVEMEDELSDVILNYVRQ